MKYVYSFGGGEAEGAADMKNLLGGKGANLAEMSNIGIPVPPGFTLTTEACVYFMEHDQTLPDGLEDEVAEHLNKVENSLGLVYGDPENPLLFSVRSGARQSMPGMMDSVLNLGLNDKTLEGFIKKSGNERAAWDSFRRFIYMYGNVVLGVDSSKFEALIEEMKKDRGVDSDSDLSVEDLKTLTDKYKNLVEAGTGNPFPDDPLEQLWGGILAVFKSWNIGRAVEYRRIHHLPDHWGTAVNVQSMVFGNMGEASATGVAFTRDPATGKNIFYGEYLVNAQGEDVVAGIRTPQPLNDATKSEDSQITLESIMPELYNELNDIRNKLENHYRDTQDIEFTIQEGKLWMLQTRAGKRTAHAALNIAVDMVEEGLISTDEALLRVDPEQLNQLLFPIFDFNDLDKAKSDGRFLARGLNAGPGAATGKVVFTADEAVRLKERGDKVILTRIETSPEDIAGMNAAEGILTARGGMTSHAAIVARGMGKCCVAGCGALEIDYASKQFTVDGKVVKEGDEISINGNTGDVILGVVGTSPSEIVQVVATKSMKAEDSELYQKFEKLMTWADEKRRLNVRANADTPHDSEVALSFGAEGIGLCRTEHMFFEGDRIDAVREMILADDKEGRQKALDKLLPMQREDFIGIYKAMNGLPVTIRTLDPPLHEFLPHDEDDIRNLADKMGVTFEKLQAKVNSLHEVNPMLGHRGCRLGLTYPEITAMQARAIIEAAVEVKKSGTDVKPEIMIPLVGHWKELRDQKAVVTAVADEILSKTDVKIEYLIGTMIELPRASLTADQIAKEADFFSFGTNDLTQTTFGFSRDDAGKFLGEYEEKKIYERDVFQTIDFDGVGELIRIGVEKGRSTRPDLKIGICGEHGGDPLSVEFCHNLGLDYVSCSPYRVPIARLAAAQAVLKENAD
ncbi:MAG: pyruvate, phosphate dikinase [Candidatus Marinimicrobia bacterium]|nr:pyruvate, phosphate dikinase [Candidatus Neomarinimicrobiota bacterium]